MKISNYKKVRLNTKERFSIISDSVKSYWYRTLFLIYSCDEVLESIAVYILNFIKRLLSNKKLALVLFVIMTVLPLTIYQGGFSEELPQIEQRQLQIVTEVLGCSNNLDTEKPLTLSPAEEETLFIHSLSQIEAGNTEESFLIARFLNESASSEAMLGGSYWLTGRILLLDEDSNTDPEESFLMCMDVYSVLDMNSGRYRCMLGLVDTNLQKGQVAEARRWLILAFRLALKADLNLSLYHARAGMVSLAENDFEHAISHFLEEARLHESSGELDLTLDVYTIIVTLYLLLEDFERADYYHQLSIHDIDKEKLPITYLHAMANAYLLNDCEASEEFNTEQQVHVYRRSLIKSAVQEVCGN
jgi:tetratricopeptide (TPR) repeat protein